MKPIYILFLCLFIFSCAEDMPQNSNGAFTKLNSSRTGVDFKNTLKENLNTSHNILSFDYFHNGAGVAIGDINNDGLSDLVFAANQGVNKIYLNKGNFKFEDISSKSNLDKYIGWSTGVTMADVNNDGWLDIYICQAGPDNDRQKRRNLLFINNKNLSFTEQAQQYGLADFKLGTQAAFFDYNRDGWLDCYVMNESIYPRIALPKVLQEIKNEEKLRNASGVLYRNDKGRFTDVSKEAGILKYGYGLGLFVGDFNDDFYPDIYVANDYSAPDMMWINQKNGTFKDEIKARTDHTSWFSMGIDVADIDNDGNLDIGAVDMATHDHLYGKTLMASMNPKLFDYVINDLNYQRQHMFNALQLNNGNGIYSNVASSSNVNATDWSWSALFADFDNDGDKDYYVTNGYKKCHRDNDFQNKLKATMQQHNGKVPANLRADLYNQIPSYRTKNILFENKGAAKFEPVDDAWGINDMSFSNGAAYGDLDNDGDLDLVINNIDDEAFIYKNNTTSNYLRIQLKGKNINYGTRVKIYTNGNLQVQEYNPVRGYMSKSEDFLHFGLGDASQVDSLIVIWQDKKTQKLSNIKANQLLVLAHKNAKNIAPNTQQTATIFSRSENQIPFKHTENTFNDFEKEVLLPYKQSTLGPFLSVGDVDKNGLDDVFIGGAKGQAGALMLQQKNGTWTPSSQAVFNADKDSEDMKSIFVDIDNDGNLDLYVVSGGSEFTEQNPALQDRLYTNDGKGNFSKNQNALPQLRQTGMQVTHSDYDQDGDQDLFLSGRIKPQRYPYSVKSTILRNDKGKLTDISTELPDELTKAGIINDALWLDIDQDDDDDLIIAGEWNAIKIFKNQDGKLSPFDGFDKAYRGWWYTLEATDIDNDGDMDIVAGNLGLNSKFTASEKKPFSVYANDFDANGSNDIVLAKNYKGEQVPVRGRQCSSEQMPFIAQKFKTYESFAKANITDILGDDINSALHLSVNLFESSVFINDGTGRFTRKKLPHAAQRFPVFGIVVTDLNDDNFPDLILTGNLYGMEIETPQLDAGKGLVLLNDTKGNFTPISSKESGILIRGDLRDAAILNTDEGPLLVVTRNNDTVVTYLLQGEE